MKTKYDKKTSLQLRIESSVTHERSYQRVPYTKLFGQKFALKQWQLFSGLRCFNIYNCSSDKTPLLKYLSVFDKSIIQKVLTEPLFAFVYLQKLEEVSRLEKKVKPMNLESV